MEAWQWVSLLPEVEVSNLEKIPNLSDLSKERLAQYHNRSNMRQKTNITKHHHSGNYVPLFRW